MTTTQSKPELARPPFWRDVRVLRVVGQIAAVVVVFFLLRYFWGNLVDNFNRLGISLSFDFLNSPTNFAIPYHQGPDGFAANSPLWEMVLIGVQNTFLAGFFGIILASIVGLIIGVSRLSENWLINKASMVYVETFRNIPPLVIIIFFGFALFFFGPFPIFRESWEVNFFGTDNLFLILNKDKWGVPGLTQTGNLGLFWIVLAIGIVAAAFVWRWRSRMFDRTGQPHHRVLWFTGVLLAFALVGYFATGQPFEISWPALTEDRRLVEGGFSINWGFISVTVALGLYTASHIGEILRGSILAIHTGQSEAANALALSGFQRYRFVILPQAMRIAIPPTINQYLNLVKNTSLATAVGYADITALTKTSIGNGRPTFQSVVILMAVYLAFSLIISLILNIVNRRLQLVDR
ncbi:MAG: ABC transporter permease subunit [Actinobacteria bacterium]|nr:MAG: ABC transporter permease subunit [Actinomycetota bacterium]REK40730.1 MAG: ABC transporter permease subunit [Actinomycetota bacterium]